MARNSMKGFAIKWAVITLIIVGILSHFGIISVNDPRLRNVIQQAQSFIEQLFGGAQTATGDVLKEAKHGLRSATQDVQGAVRSASQDSTQDVGKVVGDFTKEMQSGVSSIKQEKK